MTKTIDPEKLAVRASELGAPFVVEYTIPRPQANPPRQVVIGGFRGNDEVVSPKSIAEWLNKLNPEARAFVRPMRLIVAPENNDGYPLWESWQNPNFGDVNDIVDFGQDRQWR